MWYCHPASRISEADNRRNKPKDAQRIDPSPLRLVGLSIFIIHIKESVTDGPHPDDQILRELRTQAEGARLGCDFHISSAGEGIWI